MVMEQASEEIGRIVAALPLRQRLAFTLRKVHELEYEAIGRSLVEGAHVACVNLFPSVTSIYRWRGAIEEAHEVAMIAKTGQANWALSTVPTPSTTQPIKAQAAPRRSSTLFIDDPRRAARAVRRAPKLDDHENREKRAEGRRRCLSSVRSTTGRRHRAWTVRSPG